MKSPKFFTANPWALGASAAAALLALLSAVVLARLWRAQSRRQGFLNVYEAKLRRAIAEGVDARAEVKKTPFQYEDLLAMEKEAYVVLGREAGELLSQVIRGFEAANQAIEKVVRQKRLGGVKLQSVMWKEDLRARIEEYSEALAGFSSFDRALDAIVGGARSPFFNRY